MITTFVATLWGAMLETDADFTFEQAASLIDQYIDDGHSFSDLIGEINGILKTSGFCIKYQEP
ncbi:MAG: hypothetical protein LBI03_03220 [Clostridiales bacterium]|nr:hypothetical protein [Clostridiales bacterium]